MRNNPEERQHMFQIIEQWKQSGLSQNAFCEQQSMRFHKFYYWYKCYRRVTDISDENNRGFVKLKIEKPSVASLKRSFGQHKNGAYAGKRYCKVYRNNGSCVPEYREPVVL
jgi:hypothetical protein